MREFSRRLQVSSAHVIRILNGNARPSVKLCLSISKVLGTPLEEIYRLAGFLPSLPEKDEQQEELLYQFGRLTGEEKQYALVFIKALAEKH